MRKKTKFFIFAGIITILSAIVLPAYADITDPLVFEPQVGIPGFNENTVLSKNNTSYIGKMIKAFYDYGLAIGGILSAIVILAAGVLWLSSAGSSDKISQAKGLIGGSITGLLLLFCAWILLNTVNPYLTDFKINQIKIIEKISYCCDSVKGNVSMLKDEDGSTYCPVGSNECTGNSKCYNKGANDKGQNQFGCVDRKNSYCCEYKSNSDYTYCKSISIEQTAQGESCSTINPDNNIWKWKTTHNGYCPEHTMYFSDGDINCLTDICKNVDNSETCIAKNITVYCYCYNGMPWYGKKGKEGDPCGNEDGSICTSKGKGGTLNPSCTEPGWSHDYHYNSRSCGENLYCCYPD